MHTTHFCKIAIYLLLLLSIGCRRTLDEMPTPTVTMTPPEMTIAVEMPSQVERGQRFNVLVRVSNLSAETVENLSVVFPIPTGVVNIVTPIDATENDDTLMWSIDKILAGASLTEFLTFEAPFDSHDLTLPATQLLFEDAPIASTVPSSFAVAGGNLPIEIAREKVGEAVSVVGAVTFYAGRTFYVADETGGIRVQVPEDAPNLTFALGQMVTVAGNVSLSGDTAAILLDAETLRAAPCPTCSLLAIAATEEKMLGQLVSVAGTVREVVVTDDGTRIVLERDDGAMQPVWIDERLGISAESLILDQQVTIIGIYDDWNGERVIAPRQQTDLTLIFPQALRLTSDVPTYVPITKPITHTLTLHNDSDETHKNIVVSVTVPRLFDDLFAGTVITTSGNGRVGTDGIIYWGVPELLSNSSHTLTYKIEYFGRGAASTELLARAESSADPAKLTETIYVGQPVPIFAIQEGEQSPLRGRDVLIEGVVTAVTAERGGFFMQQQSNILVRGVGIFVETLGEPTVVSGDVVQVRGMVRERNAETIVAAARDGIALQSRDNPLPEPLPLDPVGDSNERQAYMEPFEGMLVELMEPMLVVTSTAETTTVVYERHGLETSEAAHFMLVRGLPSLERGEVLEPFLGVVVAEFDQYVIYEHTHLFVNP